jgi:hypothetical protein
MNHIAPEQLLREFGGLDAFEFTPTDIPGIQWWDLESHQV